MIEPFSSRIEFCCDFRGDDGSLGDGMRSPSLLGLNALLLDFLAISGDRSLGGLLGEPPVPLDEFDSGFSFLTERFFAFSSSESKMRLLLVLTRLLSLDFVFLCSSMSSSELPNLFPRTLAFCPRSRTLPLSSSLDSSSCTVSDARLLRDIFESPRPEVTGLSLL